MSRRKRVQVGWYCDHKDEPYLSRTHVERTMKRGEWVNRPAPNTIASHQGLDYHDPKKRPPCPLIEPVYVYREVTP